MIGYQRVGFFQNCGVVFGFARCKLGLKRLHFGNGNKGLCEILVGVERHRQGRTRSLIIFHQLGEAGGNPVQRQRRLHNGTDRNITALCLIAFGFFSFVFAVAGQGLV